jgi:hypothetical protein
MTATKDIVDRLKGEYLEMPGLRLKPKQVQRLCGVERTLCQRVLDALVGEQFLCLRPDGHYARLTDGEHLPRPRPAKADHPSDRRVEQAS